MQNTQVKPESFYYGSLRMSMLGLVEGRPRRVLEVGCGHGQVLLFLKRQRWAEFVAGVELVPEVADIARRNPELDLVLTGDVEQIPLDFRPGSFDLIIASHVLEHVKDPWAVARRLRKLLRSGGQFLGSLPNVRNARICLPLVFAGKWQYAEQGILDWTHTKFFTKSTIHDLLRSAGFKVQKIEPEFFARAAVLNHLTLGLFQHLLCFTYNFSARQIEEECSAEEASERKGKSTIQPACLVAPSWDSSRSPARQG